MLEQMSKNPLFRNGEVNESEKVIRNPQADPDHHQKHRESPRAYACQALSMSVSVFVSYPVYRMTDRTIAIPPPCYRR